jgi:hypothetical protein
MCHVSVPKTSVQGNYFRVPFLFGLARWFQLSGFSMLARVICLVGARRKESHSGILVVFVAKVDFCSKRPYEDVVEAIERLKRNDPTLTELE